MLESAPERAQGLFLLLAWGFVWARPVGSEAGGEISKRERCEKKAHRCGRASAGCRWKKIAACTHGLFSGSEPTQFDAVARTLFPSGLLNAG